MEPKRVVWLCHLANEELNQYFGIQRNEIAYWVTQFLDIMKGHNLDIHIVCPNYYTNLDTQIKFGEVTYHLYKYYSGWGDDRSSILELALRNCRNICQKIEEIVDSIHPDVVHLYGAENITYSAGVLPLMEKYPVLVTFQGYIQLTKDFGGFLKKFTINRRIKIEDTILTKATHVTFGEIEETSRKYYLTKYGNKPTLFLNFPTKLPNIDASKATKEYDVVFWGRVTSNKGVGDLIRAVSKIKINRANVSCLILGGGSEVYMNELKNLVEELQLEDNIIFGGFQKTNEELFVNAAKARVYALPTYFDALPGSIRESMSMKLPVVTYPVGDIPYLNTDKQTILLANYKDIDSLAANIEKLLADKELYHTLSENAFQMMMQQNDNEYIATQMIDCYKECIKSR